MMRNQKSGTRTMARVLGALAGAALSVVAWGQALTNASVLMPAGPMAPQAAFGHSVAFNGRTAAVGSMSDNVVQLFTRDAKGRFGAPVALADPLLRDKEFGKSVAMDGNTLLVGAPAMSPCSPVWPQASGVALVFRVGAAGDPVFAGELRHGGVDRLDGFGRAVAISGSAALVGAPYDNSAGHSSGAAYVFREVNGVWRREAQLLGVGAGQGDLSGWAVSLSGDVAVVGAPFDPTSAVGAGSVRVFERIGGSWVQTGDLQPPTPVSAGYFGVSLATDGERIVVGETGRGRAYVFARSASGWALRNILSGSRPGQFGCTVAIDGPTLLVGEHLSSRVHRFEATGLGWTAAQIVTPPSPAVSGTFGSALSLFRGEVLVGARLSGANGAAAVMSPGGVLGGTTPSLGSPGTLSFDADRR